MDGFLDKANEQADALRDKTDLDEKAQDAWDQHGDRVSEQLDQHGDKIDAGIDRGADFANERTGGRFEDQIGQGTDRLQDGLDQLGGQEPGQDSGAER